jgi:hypothetical protein
MISKHECMQYPCMQYRPGQQGRGVTSDVG